MVMAAKYLPEAIVLCGLPSSGKTTEALKWVNEDPNRRCRINYDDLRLEMFGPNWVWNRKDEATMQARAVEMFENAMKLGISVIIDNTNTSRGARAKWLELAKRYNAPAEVREVGSNLSIWDLIKRDNKREKRVGRAVIERMALFGGYIDWSDKEAYPNEGFVVCDLDGTLADISHRRHHVTDGKKNWPAFFANVSKDSLNAPVADLLDMFADDGYHILIVSGRPIDPCGIPTQDWLNENDIRYDHLFMRQGGDSRSDVIVKQEILDLLPKDRIDYVLDDRNSVVEMWRKNGLTCLQVADGNF